MPFYIDGVEYFTKEQAMELLEINLWRWNWLKKEGLLYSNKTVRHEMLRGEGMRRVANRGRPHALYSRSTLEQARADIELTWEARDGRPRKGSISFAGWAHEYNMKLYQQLLERFNNGEPDPNKYYENLKRPYVRMLLFGECLEDTDSGKILKSDNPDTDDELCKNDLWDESASVLCPPLASYIMVGQPT